MQITEVDNNGAVLVYRSNRSGFSKYLMGKEAENLKLSLTNPFPLPAVAGQLLEIANEIYGLDLTVKIIDAENDIIKDHGTAGPIDMASGLKSVVVKYRLDFDNTEYVMTHWSHAEQNIYWLCFP